MKAFRDTALFHIQERMGRGGKPIKIVKFRTMKKGSHALYENIYQGDLVGRKAVKDNRATRLGKMLRKTGIDEWPQLLNFLKGESRLFGFRPLLKADYDSLPKDIQRIYDEIGPGLNPIALPFWRKNLSKEQVYAECRRFYGLWKKNRPKAIATFLAESFRRGLAGKRKKG